MMNVGFEIIRPTPDYPQTVSRAQLNGLTWDSQRDVVLKFKSDLKIKLREVQCGRCCFCRRQLFDDYATHLEHFVEKSLYTMFSFEIRNLALSCGTCNGQKNGYVSKLNRKRKDRHAKSNTLFAPRCPVLSSEILNGADYPARADDFRWVHPHFDMFSTHIELSRGWIFRGKTRKGMRTIDGVKLNEIGKIEKRALNERLQTRGGRLSMLVGAISELEYHRAKEVAAAIVKVIKRRKSIA
ncbi:MAG: hypothetical protein LPK11_01375 [Chromatiaceae bacterium]|nr:hypothetical protein [Chromatiaceae bacterium]